MGATCGLPVWLAEYMGWWLHASVTCVGDWMVACMTD